MSHSVIADELPRSEKVYAAAARATAFFMKDADVHRTLIKLAQVLEADAIPYALVGALALSEYGYERVTADVDLLMTHDGLARFKQKHLGRGYLEKFPGSRGVRDTETGVTIDVVLSGDYPGDGLPKPVSFPDPATVATRSGSLWLLPLNKLIELKLASGLSAAHRLKDLADVLELIRMVQIPLELGLQLDASVRVKFEELWHAARAASDEE